MAILSHIFCIFVAINYTYYDYDRRKEGLYYVVQKLQNILVVLHSIWKPY